MAPTKVLTGARVVLPTGTVDGASVTVEGTRIAATAPGASPSPSPGAARSICGATGWSPASSTSTTTAAAGCPS